MFCAQQELRQDHNSISTNKLTLDNSLRQNEINILSLCRVCPSGIIRGHMVKYNNWWSHDHNEHTWTVKCPQLLLLNHCPSMAHVTRLYYRQQSTLLPTNTSLEESPAFLLSCYTPPCTYKKRLCQCIYMYRMWSCQCIYMHKIRMNKPACGDIFSTQYILTTLT